MPPIGYCKRCHDPRIALSPLMVRRILDWARWTDCSAEFDWEEVDEDLRTMLYLWLEEHVV